jgi:hypothetical protein
MDFQAANPTQEEIEVLTECLMAFDSSTACHPNEYFLVIAKLLKQLDSMATAANTDTGSHFGSRGRFCAR